MQTPEQRIAELEDEILTLKTEVERLTDENNDLSRELGIKAEPREYGC